MLAMRYALLTAARRSPRMLAARSSSGHHKPTPEEIAKVPPQYRDITWDDVALPQGSWQARYDEIQRKSNIFLGISVVVFAVSMYAFIKTQDWQFCPDEPAPRWYPEDRFKAGTGSVL